MVAILDAPASAETRNYDRWPHPEAEIAVAFIRDFVGSGVA
jgi:hypothetical protein